MPSPWSANTYTTQQGQFEVFWVTPGDGCIALTLAFRSHEELPYPPQEVTLLMDGREACGLAKWFCRALDEADAQYAEAEGRTDEGTSLASWEV